MSTEDTAAEIESISGLWGQSVQEAVEAITKSRDAAIKNVTTALSIVDANLMTMNMGVNQILAKLKEDSEGRELALEEIARSLRE